MSNDRINRFAVWGNDRKREGKQDADFTGSASIQCPACMAVTDYWQNGWKRRADAKPNAPALSGNFRAKFEQHPRHEERPQESQPDFDDELPF